jgi:predicted transcriptional regulator of viral defense system
MRLTYVSVLRDLVATRALLTTEDADAFLRSCGAPAGKHRLRTRNRALAALCATGELVRIQRGLYARGRPDCAPDPYTVASWLAPDAVLGLCSALEVHGVIAPRGGRCIYFTRLDDAGRGPVWHGKRMQRISHPVPLLREGKEFVETTLVEARAGGRMRVSTIERAFVDVMDRPRLTGDWPTILQMLDAIPALDLDRVVHYVGCLRNATTAAKTGWFLERRRDQLDVTAVILCRLEQMRPRSPHYLSRSQRISGRYATRWNLVVPPHL